VLALIVLIYLNWRLTAVTILVLGTFWHGDGSWFKRLRPLFRERGQINAEVTGRLGESLAAFASSRRTRPRSGKSWSLPGGPTASSGTLPGR